MPSMGKSVSQTDLNFPPPPPEKGELLRMKSQALIEGNDETEEIRGLMRQVKQA